MKGKSPAFVVRERTSQTCGIQIKPEGLWRSRLATVFHRHTARYRHAPNLDTLNEVYSRFLKDQIKGFGFRV